MITAFNGPYRFLSNFYPFWGTTVEHHFQAAKTLDVHWRTVILAAKTPGDAKRLGRQALIRPDWEQIKVGHMYSLLAWKFSHPELRVMLLQTGDQELVEGNTWGDQFWGVCNGKGFNVLGCLLMQVRREL